MILFIHGFNSSKQCTKCMLLKKYSKELTIPSLDLLDIDATLKRLEKIMSKGVDIIVGASFGGFYAQYLAKKHHIPLILINPVVEPLKLIESVDLSGVDQNNLIKDINYMSEFNNLHSFSKEVEVLFGLEDDVVDPKEHSNFFALQTCKFYADDHRLIVGFSDYLLHTNTLLSKYL